ncbi:protein kinase family protein [Aspergillus lucknowensis]|uniref:Kinase-like domain-containing protein n=1 Tax=Aspergillus lucknowensis TaxID=176173 RepID=A0ABR4M0R0_9EURO
MGLSSESRPSLKASGDHPQQLESTSASPTLQNPFPDAPIMQRESSTRSLPEDNTPVLGTLRKLQNSLREHRVDSIEKGEFVPRSIIESAVKDNVSEFLAESNLVGPESISSFAQLISLGAPKLFAILVDLKKPLYIIRFIKAGIRDENLPFRVDETELSAIHFQTKQGEPIQVLREWDTRSLKRLKKKQYRMLGPVFEKGKHYDLDDLHILPFRNDYTASRGKQKSAGAFGEVSQACIHEDHHLLETPSARDGIMVAIKRMFHHDDFKNERKVYRDLGASSHRHLIELLFTYQKEKSYHFVFPWADGNLKDYWEDNPDPVLCPQLLTWSLEQMVGIASGLSFFHEFTNSDLTSSENHRFGRHGDIKAQNILRFKVSDDPGILKIADLGLASVRGERSRSKVDPDGVIPSPTYSPPDVQRRCWISRKFDIWSLGCLYLEFLTYLILGYGGIPEFSSRRLYDGSSDGDVLRTDSFYSPDYQRVKTSVVCWVNKLKQNPRCSWMMYDILDLVLREMIVIDQNKRSSSQKICRKLRAILDRARADEAYLRHPNPVPENASDRAFEQAQSSPFNIRQPSKTHHENRSVTKSRTY